LLQFAGVVAVPLLLAALAALAATLSALADHRVSDAVVEQRVGQLEGAVERQAKSAARIEAAVVAMGLEQAQFVGGANARIRSLEREVQ
jgi:cob(I)alamin adenosyltransferase